MKRTALALIGALVMAASAHAESANQTQNQSTKLNKATNTVNNIRQADPPKASTGTVSGVTGTPTSIYHPPAAPTMKRVDTIKVPPPQSNK